MNFEMTSGTLYMNDELLSNVSYGSMDATCEDISSERLSFNVNAEFSADLTYVNYDLFDKLCRPQEPSKFKIVAEVPIMIQARWHKKRRINKKWLKRYGMKPDIVKVEMDTDNLTYTPGEIVGYTDGKIDSDKLKSFMKAYQNKKTLGMEEIWNISVFLNISLIKYNYNKGAS